MCILDYIIVILLIWIAYLLYTKREHFAQAIPTIQIVDPKNKKSLEDLRKNKPLNNIFEDKLFSDVITYENDLDGRLGLDKCIENCKGLCVEYGETGLAHCFPEKNIVPFEYEDLRGGKQQNLNNLSYYEKQSIGDNESIDKRVQKMDFVNLR
jgi:hypothetical protein